LLYAAFGTAIHLQQEEPGCYRAPAEPVARAALCLAFVSSRASRHTHSRALRAALGDEAARIAIWRTNEENLGVEHSKFMPTEAISRYVNGWTLLTERWLLEKISRWGALRSFPMRLEAPSSARTIWSIASST
jgi:hypothetical protein